MGFPEVYIKEIACGISVQGLIKNKVEFLCQRKNHVEFQGALAFRLGICKGCNTTLQNFQWWSCFVWNFQG